jgi:hypothetical protein
MKTDGQDGDKKTTQLKTEISIHRRMPDRQNFEAICVWIFLFLDYKKENGTPKI